MSSSSVCVNRDCASSVFGDFGLYTMVALSDMLDGNTLLPFWDAMEGEVRGLLPLTKTGVRCLSCEVDCDKFGEDGLTAVAVVAIASSFTDDIGVE